jgi:Flp pilus assembly protein TadG
VHAHDRDHSLRRARKARGERGQSLVEFSLMMIFLVVLLMGVLDLARAYFTYLGLKDAAAEGAYFGSAFPQCVDDDVGGACGGDHNIDFRVRNTALRGGLIDWADARVATTLPATLEAGQVLTVTVDYNYTLLTPFVGTIVNGQTLTLTARSAATIIRVPNCSSAELGCQ